MRAALCHWYGYQWPEISEDEDVVFDLVTFTVSTCAVHLCSEHVSSD